MRNVALNSEWKLYYFPQGSMHIGSPEELAASGLVSIEAEVPGNVELDLSRAGVLPGDLYKADNINSSKRFETYEWWYETEFPTPDEVGNKKVELCFEGVDCLAQYWLNGRTIGSSENMFIEHRLDIADVLDSTKLNVLTIRLRSPIIEALGKEYFPSMIALPSNMEQLWLRKAAHSYSWDIMPRAISAGLWRPVRLVIYDDLEITDLFFYTLSASQMSAKIGIFYNIRANIEIIPRLAFRFSFKCGSSSYIVQKAVYFVSGTVFVEVENPALWWPAGYGIANLYDVKTELLLDGQEVASRDDCIGIRTVELIRSGETVNGQLNQFFFKVNGTPVFCKGSNWVPADAFHSRDAARYEPMIGLFTDSNCNMVRCWGGGVYEDHAFFDICDRNGLMVWQDFALACAMYPQTQPFFKVMQKEVAAVIKKLRNHCSIVLWCGDNESDEFIYERGMNPASNKLSREVLAEAVSLHDPYRPYLQSSPYYSPEITSSRKLQQMPEAHLWGPRDYYKSSFYTKSESSFISEIGYHGCPNLSSIRKFIDEDHIWPWEGNNQWITHCSDSIGSEGPYAYRVKLMADQIKELFGVYPDNINDFILASQISQAEAKKFFIEMMRLKKWRASGIIWWNMIDGWPQFSDAVVDYYFNPKLAYHYIKRVQQPVCIMIQEPEDWHVTASVGNDTMRDVLGCFHIKDADSQEIMLDGNFCAKANETISLGKFRISRSDHRLLLIQWTIQGKTYGNHYLLGSPPFSLEQYRAWLTMIAQMGEPFVMEGMGD